ncbi:type I glyceraldehyde-3-phosphate dehydrogenase [Phaeobacter gallaeciensis]|jgi:glyceraldehyde 3-phosphate dehydrogenase|uniref:type I glyceraldehyde-3-phosphate dehydrogenase n=1 Tax=Phaeobacter gallaeciensis TaxID=60890 RepID=UPI00237F4FE9|nr:type I glyceraldehyde-3-phosphate dehydrogenase [Phaeobacter gallaeciensis]MDE4302332.1 type I glyceraldehyde-3-phosphate dehydrogenase [Phaeobacter gallaeciensis]MDE4306690.1 type I glyceraldehyde-3-phosphate dehydrogenase [Phaeobacter gallaeciensis]MDE4311191.1 type I glyceraldehyde-3-phosphate dehydrogenase [Phaeobacter gallaeciensis]MDE4315654.1 type I glyceraldehyde-3-phosphate dehydrogenase [Phaeobacter gallaeciensis]MDE4320118.1 type I glyceraldehyde-3-phosphate dehydrogenase [Phaeob
MTLKIAINGFGRIGRGVLRALLERGDTDIDVVAINDLAPAETLLHLLKYDSVHGRLRAPVSLADGVLRVGRHSIRLSAERNPADLPWEGVDIAYECTGLFTSRDAAAAHLGNGSKRVLISAPGKEVDRTVVYGVNHMDLTADDLVVSNASCTTNCLAPVAQVLDQAFGIKTGYMTTIHAYTGDQPTHDSPHKDPYRARAAALSMIPTSTGAARAIAEVLPHLKGRLEGSAIRVPTPNVSVVDLSFVPERAATVEEVNDALRAASENGLAGILAYEEDPMVSVDFNHDPHSSCFAAAQTAVTSEGLVRVVSWYDNEWGFSNRMLDTGRHMGRLMKPEEMALAS